MTIQERLCGQEVQTASASEEQTSFMNLTVRVDRIVAVVLISSVGNKTSYHDAVNSVWQHRWIGLDKDTCQIELQ